MTSVIQVTNLTKDYGEVHALRGVSFTVEQGEIFGLLGPNGAGKTTFLEIAEGHRAATGGSVSVFGLDPRRAGAQVRERIGIVPQNAHFEFQLTAREHLALFAGYYRKALPVDDLLALVGLSDKAGTRVGRLSGGQQRRFDMALALVGDPEIIFLDEPTTGFDVEARDSAWDLIVHLRRAGKSVVLTTHNKVEAQRLSDRVAVLFDGKIVALGDPAQLLADEKAATITFRAGPLRLADLPVTLSAFAREVAGELVISADDSRQAMYDLTTWAVEQDVPLPGLEVRRPTLEELYLDLLTPAAILAKETV
jgi:ABC-2 type transport system ATP-binding protein